jgi:tetratricopeptide (TPR) repeat protein
MAKSPADRYQRAGDFARALSDPVKLAEAVRDEETEEQQVGRWLAPASAVLAIVAVVAALLLRGGPPLDPNKVVVFPMGENPPGATSEGTGVEVGLMIGTALEYTEPLEWIDGLPLLDTRLRSDIGQLTAADARRITRAAGARWYVDGTVVRRRDSVTVVVRLNDAGGDSVVGRASGTRIAPEAAQAGLTAINHLLPKLLSPGQRIGDLSALADRHPAAVANWLQGEREYRRFNFPSALEFQKRAVSEDSALAVAALRGAQAASWLDDLPEAAALSETALKHASLLPPRTADFTRGLKAYLSGQADSAVHWLTLALKRTPDWTEAHMALGEVYYHLLPTVNGLHDSLAESEFMLAAADTGFTLPLFHLAEIAVRRGTSQEAEQRIENFVRHVQDEASRTQLVSMLACAHDGRKAMDWPRLAAVMPDEAVRAAQALAVGGRFLGCAEDGLRVLFDNRELPLGHRWGAFLGLQGVLAAEGRVTELRRLVDSAVPGGMDLAPQLYLLDALARVKVEDEASAVAERLARDDMGKARPFTLWLLGAWYARSGDSAATNTVRKEVARRAANTKDPWIARYGDALTARLKLLGGDTATAIEQLRHGLSAGRREKLDWDVGESLAADRLLLAELLLSRGQAAEAMSVAAVFDHPAPAVFLPFLPASLTLRQRAALALGDEKQARLLHDRLMALGHGDEMTPDPSPLTSREVP